jgi:BlaI family penicillinase repressor
MKKIPQISRAEYEIMKILWAEYPLSTNEITERARRSHSWNQKTIHTLLSRLAAKGAISYEKQGRMYHYSPLISRESYLQQENHTFLNRFYGGEIAPMLSSLLAHAELSDEDLKDLHEIINSRTRSDDES